MARLFMNLCVLIAFTVIVMARPSEKKVIETEDEVPRSRHSEKFKKVMGDLAELVSIECVAEAAEHCVSKLFHPAELYTCGEMYFKHNSDRCIRDIPQEIIILED